MEKNQMMDMHVEMGLDSENVIDSSSLDPLFEESCTHNRNNAVGLCLVDSTALVYRLRPCGQTYGPVGKGRNRGRGTGM